MNSSEIRNAFLSFFGSKTHQIVPSAPMVIKDDPTLMFTNAGMNQFKEIFLGHSEAKYTRITDTQKCLRVSGKHNDLDEVGHDTYHHTMFEMLGNWSFGDYFKKEAIEWAWEILTEVFGINKEDLYITVFGGDKKDSLPDDTEALNFWKKILPDDRILYGSKKDNFWEMGETGPCGPCSEIHVDIRSNEEKEKIKGRDLVNKDHPEVIEIWNLVFIEYNRNARGELIPLPQKHIDTGMGFERLCMIVQGKKSNYDTDVFQPIIRDLSKLTGLKYDESHETEIAMRVVADHLRAVSFAIADGQIPSNTGAGYVIRRILRRAVRYGFTFLGQKEPFIFRLVSGLVQEMGAVFPELEKQQEFIIKVIAEEEHSFLRTLSLGIKRFDHYIKNNPDKKIIDGNFAFELFDTYGFPVDLTQLMAKEIGWEVDMDGFTRGLSEQKKRSRDATVIGTEDWIEVNAPGNTEFIGYDTLETEPIITRYRKIQIKKKTQYQLVFNETPFYAESGGQIGDKGYIEYNGDKVFITDTKKENNLIVHFTDRLPKDLTVKFKAVVDKRRRVMTACNHSATHLLHHALRKVLGTHVEQKGSFVGPDHLRFDFSHYQKLEQEELATIESIVNEEIRKNIPLYEQRSIPMAEALDQGAIAFFGEKYGDHVRMIRFGDSIELCGGTHVDATGNIGYFKIISEGAIAAGIRRIEAITGKGAEAYITKISNTVDDLKILLKNPDILKGVHSLMEHQAELVSKLELLQREKLIILKQDLINKIELINGINFIGKKVNLDVSGMKDLSFELKGNVDDLFLILGSENKGKANLAIMISDSVMASKGLNASKLVRELAKEIQGGGGGQPHFATAGGKLPSGINTAIGKAKILISTM
jgi:alanyl-tRNA synthetase